MTERKTENLVRDALRRLKYYDDNSIIVEEQKSDNPRINKLLKNASKSGKGAGYPEFIIRSTNYPDFLITIECKADIRKHESKEHDRYADYAVDGAVLYASHLSTLYDVIAIGVSGETKRELKISHFLFLKSHRTDIAVLGNELLPFSNYYESYIHHPKKFRQDYEELLYYSKELNETLHGNKIKESQRSLLISGILIALQNQAFQKGFKGHRTAKQLANSLVETVVYELSNGSIPDTNITNLRQAYSFIKTHATLSSDKQFMEDLITEIDERINPFIRTHQYFDTIGQFYIEFLRYANNDKGLGIVLTPPHITELFCELAGVNRDSVIIDNCCGTGGFLISGLQKMLQLAKGNDAKTKKIRSNQIVGIEFQDDIYALAVSNMIIHGDGKSNIYQGDCFDLTELKDQFNPTIGLLNPPYKTQGADTEELEFVLNNLQFLKQNGKCVAIIPMSCMIAQTGIKLELKRRLFQNHTIEAVMSMPEELFHNSKINMVTAVIVLTAHIPHPQGKKVWFGYWRHDGFVKVKKKGRVDSYNRWEEIKRRWLNLYNNREERRFQSIMKDVRAEDEWCAEAYFETDYSKIDEDMFMKSARQYLAFRFLNNLLDFKNQVIGKRDKVAPRLETVDTLFDVIPGLGKDRVKVVEDPENEYFIRFVRASQTYQGSIDGYVDRQTVDEKYIFGEDTIYVSTDGQGSHTYSHVSSFDFIPNSNVAVLVPRRTMNLNERIYYALCISINRFKYSYGRKPKGGRLEKLLIPNTPPPFVYNNIFETILRDWREVLKE